MSIRKCPHCQCSEGAGVIQGSTVPRALQCGDYIVCQGCMAILRLDEATQPVAVSREEIEQMSDDTLVLLASVKTLSMQRRDAREKLMKAILN